MSYDYLKSLGQIKFLLVILLGLPFLFSSSAQAQNIKYNQCPQIKMSAEYTVDFNSKWKCGVITLPLDYSNKIAGVVKLRFAWYHINGPTRPTVLAFAGGPGQASLPLSELFSNNLSSLLQSKDLLLFDARGTGESGFLKCPKHQLAATYIKDCSNILKERQLFYSTNEHVRDAEELRKALSLPSVLPFGVSYGTNTALTYARLYPQTTSKVILDSPVSPERNIYEGIEAKAALRIMKNICVQAKCNYHPRSLGDLNYLLQKMQKNSLSKKINAPYNKKKNLVLYQQVIFNLLIEADLRPADRLSLSSVLYSASQGDYIPLFSLLGIDKRLNVVVQNNSKKSAYFKNLVKSYKIKLKDLRKYSYAPNKSKKTTYPREFSDALFYLTSCTDQNLPWQQGDALEKRLFMANQELINQPVENFGGWQKEALSSLYIRGLCAYWEFLSEKESNLPPISSSIPVLILSGKDDTRTPLEIGDNIQSLSPSTIHLIFPRAGHSIISSPSKCLTKALWEWDQTGKITLCNNKIEKAKVKVLFPLSSRQIANYNTSKKQVLSAIAETLNYSFIDAYQTSNSSQVFPGLRGGWIKAKVQGKNLKIIYKNYRWTKDVILNGYYISQKNKEKMSLQINGRLKGELISIKRNKQFILTGTLNTQNISFNLLKYLKEQQEFYKKQYKLYIPNEFEIN